MENMDGFKTIKVGGIKIKMVLIQKIVGLN